MPESQFVPIIATAGDNIGIGSHPSRLAFGSSAGGAPAINYHNAVWNTTTGEWIRWVTQDAPDPGGVSYPGPGTFGVDTQTPAFVEFSE